jgi:DNA-binding NarL/FixJ family response regulator
MHAALRAGANGYVSKNLPIEQLYCVLSRVLATCQQRARREALTARSHHQLAGAA